MRAAAVLRGKLWGYPWMIGFLLLFIEYQLYRISVDPAVGMIDLTIFDAVLAGWRSANGNDTATRRKGLTPAGQLHARHSGDPKPPAGWSS